MSCPICMEEFDDGETDSNKQPVVCCAGAHDPVCRLCFREHISVVLRDSFMGSCPLICCPLTPMKPIPHSVWKQFVLDEAVREFKKFAESTVLFHCYNCDQMRPLTPQYNESANFVEIREKLVSAMANASLSEQFFKELAAFENYDMSTDDMYSGMTMKYFPSICEPTEGDRDRDKASFDTVKKVLRLVENPERRAILMARHIRYYPHVWSSCCDYEHCYSCQISRFHYGVTCAEYARRHYASSDSIGDVEFVPCPYCGVTIAKGDGCDSITCYCGNYFSWSSTLEKHKFVTQFEQAFPSNANEVSVSVLVGDRSAAEVAEQAAAASDSTAIRSSALTRLVDSWVSNNPAACNHMLVKWCKRTFAGFAAAACVAITTDSTSGRLKNSEVFGRIMPRKARNYLSSESRGRFRYPEGLDRCSCTYSKCSGPGLAKVAATFNSSHYSVEVDRYKEQTRLARLSLAHSLLSPAQRLHVLAFPAEAKLHCDSLRRLYNIKADMGFQRANSGPIDAVVSDILTSIAKESRCPKDHVAESVTAKSSLASSIFQMIHLYGSSTIQLGGYNGYARNTAVYTSWSESNSSSDLSLTVPTCGQSSRIARPTIEAADVKRNTPMAGVHIALDGGRTRLSEACCVEILSLPEQTDVAGIRPRSNVLSIGLTAKSRSLWAFPVGFYRASYGFAFTSDLRGIQVLVNEVIDEEIELPFTVQAKDQLLLHRKSASGQMTLSIYRNLEGAVSCLYSNTMKHAGVCGCNNIAVTLPDSRYSVQLIPMNLCRTPGFPHQLTSTHERILSNALKAFSTDVMSHFSTGRPAHLTSALNQMHEWWENRRKTHPEAEDLLNEVGTKQVIGFLVARFNAESDCVSVDSTVYDLLRKNSLTWSELFCCICSDYISGKQRGASDLSEADAVDTEYADGAMSGCENSMLCGLFDDDVWLKPTVTSSQSHQDENCYSESDDDMGFSLFGGNDSDSESDFDWESESESEDEDDAADGNADIWVGFSFFGDSDTDSIGESDRNQLQEQQLEESRRIDLDSQEVADYLFSSSDLPRLFGEIDSSQTAGVAAVVRSSTDCDSDATTILTSRGISNDLGLDALFSDELEDVVQRSESLGASLAGWTTSSGNEEVTSEIELSTELDMSNDNPHACDGVQANPIAAQTLIEPAPVSIYIIAYRLMLLLLAWILTRIESFTVHPHNRNYSERVQAK